jgi:hypothetical protein
MDAQYDVIMWEEQKVATRHLGEWVVFCPFHIMMLYCVPIAEQTTAKSYLFLLYNTKKTPELNR